jgi:hypothetical protein
MDITAIIENRTVRLASRVGGFLLRHALAVAVSVAAPCVLWTAVYFGLMLWVMVFGGDPGGPLAYPAGILTFFMGALAASVLVFFPVVGAAELVARRRGWPVLAQLPLSVGGLVVVCAAVAVATGEVKGAGADASVFACLLGLGLIPLVLYWWVAQSLPLVADVARRVLRWWRGRSSNGLARKAERGC